jgi:excisionase family DNA binding protein
MSLALQEPIYEDFAIRRRNPDLLSVDEAAAYTHLRPSTIRDWVLKKRIAYLKLGRRVFLKRETLDRLLSAAVVPAEEAQ